MRAMSRNSRKYSGSMPDDRVSLKKEGRRLMWDHEVDVAIIGYGQVFTKEDVADGRRYL